ncbi:Ankyrin repeat-containing domain [Phytophthora cactorum]|nr:Ankyrin repeat-containing domain [Phytophthora cactorum]
MLDTSQKLKLTVKFKVVTYDLASVIATFASLKMASPPVLLCVSLTLPPDLEAISHISELVNEYLLPNTIDSAVLMLFSLWFNASAFLGSGQLEPWMELQLEDPKRGCSALAATGAAANGHLHALEWLIQHFPQHSSRSRCLIAAAENGRIEIARYLRHKCTGLMPPLQSIGCAAIVKALVDRFPFVSIRPALLLATENRQYEVVELLLHSSDSSILSTIGKAVENAATCGDTKMAKLLVKRSSFHDAARALNIAASRNDLDIVRVLAAKRGECFKVDSFKIDALVRAAKSGRMEVVEVLVNSSNSRTKEEAVLQLASIVDTEVLNSIIRICELKTYQYLFTDAAARGLAGLVQQLMCRVDLNTIHRSLTAAALNGHTEVIKMLLGKSDLPNVAEIVEAVARNGHTSVVKLLRASTSDDAAMVHLESDQEFGNKKPRLK